MPNISQEDYLRKIYFIGERSASKQVHSVKVALSLGISRAAVSKMLKKMQTQKLVSIQLYSTVSLTPKGFKMAEQITTKHRLIETLLAQIIKVPIHEVCKEAHALEHAFSDTTIRRLAKILKYPKYCPCGSLIPYRK